LSQLLAGYAKASFESEKDQYSIGYAIGLGWDVFERGTYLLQVLSNLEILDLRGTQISDVTPLSRLTQLKQLYLLGTQVTDVSPLSKLTQLKNLNLFGTQVKDISPLSKLLQLKNLNLFKTQVKDITPLSRLIQFKQLDLSGTQVTDVSPLEHLPSLTIYTSDEDKIEQWRSIGMNVKQDSEFRWQPRHTL